MHCLRGTTILLLLAFSILSAQAQVSPAPTNPTPTPSAELAAPPATSPSPHALDSADLQAFFDGIFPLQMERSDIGGASVLVMQDGKVLLQKGYGYADVKTKKAVDPATTIFRLASISKLFTWVSVMQLHEQGKLDLDTDVNQYLDFKIKPAFGKPVTLRNLMTHTGGFEEETRDVILTDPKQAISLRDFLIQNQPTRMFAPGTVPAYSNYGVGLAGYIVQRVSGEPFEQYVQEHIFTPLGMMHSTFYQPPPKALATLPSEGYRDDTTKDPIGFEIFNPAPAGGISSTATDMSRFGQALLNGGTLDGKQFLKPATIKEMWTPQFRASNQMPPIDMGFYETWRSGVHWIGHEGDLIAFHSLFFLDPARNIILFISYNSAGGGEQPRPEIIDLFSDRYFPTSQKQVFVNESRQELEAIEGTYEGTRREDSTRLSLSALMGQRTATVDKDGVLRIADVKDLRGHPIRWKPIGKDLWQEVDGQARLFAIRNSSGHIIRVASDFPGVQAERVAWYENRKWVSLAAGFSILALTAVVLASISRFARRVFLRKRPRPAPQPGTRWLSIPAQLAAWVWMSFLAFTIGFFAATSDTLMPPTYAWDKYFVLINVVVALAIVLSLFAAMSALRIWREPVRAITKVKFSLVGVACLVFCWISIHWHLLGPVRV